MPRATRSAAAPTNSNPAAVTFAAGRENRNYDGNHRSPNPSSSPTHDSTAIGCDAMSVVVTDF